MQMDPISKITNEQKHLALVKNLLILYSPFENSTTRIAIILMHIALRLSIAIFHENILLKKSLYDPRTLPAS